MRGSLEAMGVTDRCVLGRVAVVIGAIVACSVPAAAMGALVPSAALDLNVGPSQPAVPPISRLTPATGPNATAYSYNWSGYVASAGTETFTAVTSTYVQPPVRCPVSGAYTVFWVGLDGWYNNTVEQDGTLAYCNGSTPEYSAWWEMYPTNYIQWSIPISPGDTIQALARYAQGQYVLTVRDKTKRTHTTTHQLCAPTLVCARSTAEWVIERPGYGGNNFAPLADWGTMTVPVDKASARGSLLAMKSFSHFGVDMMNNGFSYELATVGELNAHGNSFLDSWDATS